MIKSMTGFGRCLVKTAHGPIRVELKAVNHKFLEIASRLPGHLGEYEDGLRKAVSQSLRRGKIHLFVSAPDPAGLSARLVLNEDLAREVSHKIRRLKAVLKLKTGEAAGRENFLLREVLRYPDVLRRESSPGARNLFLKDLQKALRQALKQLEGSRSLEGRALEKDLRKRLAELEKSLRAVEKRLPVLHGEYRRSLEKRTREFIKNAQLDKERLTMEAALYVKNSDISEEVTRLQSHIHAMRKALRERGELGRKIDFIAQEMYREANTMGAKSSDVAIANQVIHVKSTIEKIREQAQNVE